MKRDLEIEIGGQRLKIRTDEDEAYMRRLAAFVDEKMRELGHGLRGTTSLNVALLAALRIADDYHRAMAEGGDADGAFAALASKIEAVIGEA